MADTNVSAFQSTFEQNTPAAPLNAFGFVASQIMARIATGMPVKVMSVDVDKQTVDVLPLVNQIDGGGNAQAHVTVYGIPYFQLQCGISAIDMTPVAGDLGWLTSASRDISSVKANKGQANPGSRRQFSMADGMYLGGILNAVATQYIRFTNDGIQITTPNTLTIAAEKAVDIGSSEAITLHSDSDIVVTAGGDLKLSGDSTAELSASLVFLGEGGGNLATINPPAKTLLDNFAASGPSAVVSNPTTPQTSALNTLLTGSTITTGLANLVSMGTITSGQATAINNALTVGPTSLLSANTALAAHTDRLSGITQPTTAAEPSLAGVVGLGAGLDNLAGGQFASAATAIPAASTGLTAGPTVAASTVYASNIVPALTAGTVTPAQVVTDVGNQAGVIGTYPIADTASYATSTGSINSASGFLGMVGNAKNTNPAVESFFGQVASPATIATLKTV